MATFSLKSLIGGLKPKHQVEQEFNEQLKWLKGKKFAVILGCKINCYYDNYPIEYYNDVIELDGSIYRHRRIINPNWYTVDGNYRYDCGTTKTDEIIDNKSQAIEDIKYSECVDRNIPYTGGNTTVTYRKLASRIKIGDAQMNQLTDTVRILTDEIQRLNNKMIELSTNQQAKDGVIDGLIQSNNTIVAEIASLRETITVIIELLRTIH